MALPAILSTVGRAATVGAGLLGLIATVFPRIFDIVDDSDYDGSDTDREAFGGQIFAALNLTGTADKQGKIGLAKAAEQFVRQAFAAPNNIATKTFRDALPYVLGAASQRTNLNSTFKVSPYITGTETSAVSDNNINATATLWMQLYQEGLQLDQSPEPGFQPAPTAGGVCGPGDMALFNPAESRFTPARHVQVTGPDGKPYWFGYRGRPVLWSGDLAAARRVDRVAKRVAKDMGYVIRRRSSRSYSSRTTTTRSRRT